MTTTRRGGWPGPRKVPRTVDWPQEMVDAIQAYADEHGVRWSEAARQLVAAGLDAQARRG